MTFLITLFTLNACGAFPNYIPNLRRGNGDGDALIEERIGKLDSENIEYYVLGDLNCNMAAPKFDNSTNILSNIAEVYGLDQLITEYTRITDKSSTLIDLIFTNTPDRVVCPGVSHIGISDHNDNSTVTLFTALLSWPMPSTITFLLLDPSLLARFILIMLHHTYIALRELTNVLS